jgi:hypothetical protein
MIARRVESWIRWVSQGDGLHSLGEGRDDGRPTTVPTSRASVGPFRAQEGTGSAAGMYRS